MQLYCCKKSAFRIAASVMILAIGTSCTARKGELTSGDGDYLTVDTTTGETYVSGFEMVGRGIIRSHALSRDDWQSLVEHAFGPDYDAEVAEDLRQRLLDEDYS
jgi:hypothetical protein